MKVQYLDIIPSRYFIIVNGEYELSTDDLEDAIRMIRGYSTKEIMLLDILERKWIDTEVLIKKN